MALPGVKKILTLPPNVFNLVSLRLANINPKMYHEKYESLLHSEGNLYFLFYFYLNLLKTTKIFSFCQRLGKLFIANIYRNGTIMYCMFSIFNTKINSFSKVFCISNKSFMLLCKTNNNTILVTKFKQIGYEGHLPNFRAGHGTNL